MLHLLEPKVDGRKKNGGKRAGSGQKKGLQQVATIDRNKVLQAWKDRASGIAQGLLGAQALLAFGTHTLMRIDEIVEYRDTGRVDKNDNPIRNKYVTKKFTVVENPHEIAEVFNHFGDVDGSGVVDDKYYFVTHKEPQNQAVDSILNRTFGRATESIEVKSTVGIMHLIKIMNSDGNSGDGEDN